MRILLLITLLFLYGCSNSVEPEKNRRAIIFPNPYLTINWPEDYNVISKSDFEGVGWSFIMYNDEGTIQIYSSFYEEFFILPDTLVRSIDSLNNIIYPNKSLFYFNITPSIKDTGALFYRETPYTLRNRAAQILLKSKDLRKYELALQVSYKDSCQKELIKLLSTMAYY